jgi:hypothetical protein
VLFVLTLLVNAIARLLVARAARSSRPKQTAKDHLVGGALPIARTGV